MFKNIGENNIGENNSIYFILAWGRIFPVYHWRQNPWKSLPPSLPTSLHPSIPPSFPPSPLHPCCTSAVPAPLRAQRRIWTPCSVGGEKIQLSHPIYSPHLHLWKARGHWTTPFPHPSIPSVFTVMQAGYWTQIIRFPREVLVQIVLNQDLRFVWHVAQAGLKGKEYWLLLPLVFNLSSKCREEKVWVGPKTSWLLGMELNHRLQTSCYWSWFAFSTSRFLDQNLRLNTVRYSISPNSAPYSTSSELCPGGKGIKKE